MKNMKEDKVDIIPAASGFFTLEPIVNEDGLFDRFAKCPIVAWRVVTSAIYNSKDTFSVAQPVTLETTGEHNFILTPSGEVVDPEVMWFKNEEDAAKEMKRKMQARAKGPSIKEKNA